MQRLFSMFPPGGPGLGLLLLRSSAAIALLVENHGHRQDLPVWLKSAAIILSITLIAGYLTPIAAAIGLLIHGLIWLTLGGGSAASVIIISLDLIALALLGPGAYSVDASLFGRRLVILPPS